MIEIHTPKLETQNTEEIIGLLIRRQAELNSLLEISQAINYDLPESTLFQMFEFVLKMHLKVGKLRLFLCKDTVWTQAAAYGVALLPSRQQYAMCKKISQFKKITFLKEIKEKELQEFEILIPVLFNESHFAYVLMGDYLIGEHVNSDAGFIQTIINVIMVATENKRLFRERLVQERLQKEVELAVQVQSMLFPRELPSNEFIDMDAVYLPHHSIGGDYYDYLELGESEFLYCIADVTGKGVSAALLMANFQANLRAIAKQKLSLTEIVGELNHVLFSSTKGERFITLFLGRFNTETKVLEYINAGHPPPLVLCQGETHLLSSGSTVIGVFEELPFIHPGKIVLQTGCMVFSYTDGLIEYDEEDSYLMDPKELKYFLEQNCKLTVGDFNKKIMKQLKQKSGKALYSDDITLLTFKVI